MDPNFRADRLPPDAAAAHAFRTSLERRDNPTSDERTEFVIRTMSATNDSDPGGGHTDPQDDDPFDWTVEEVATNFCTAELLRAPAQSHRPDLSTLKLALRENDINGEILLTDVTAPVLREDLGIKSFGKRLVIMKAIRLLQGRSRKFQDQADGIAVQFSTPQTVLSMIRRSLPLFTSMVGTSRMNSPNTFNGSHPLLQTVEGDQSLSLVTPVDDSCGSSVPPEASTRDKDGFRLPSAPRPTSTVPRILGPGVDADTRTSSLSVTLPGIGPSSKRKASSVEEHRLLDNEHIMTDTESLARGCTVLNEVDTTPTVRQHELIISEGGKKRRKLMLEPPSTSEQEQAPDNATPFGDESRMEAQGNSESHNGLLAANVRDAPAWSIFFPPAHQTDNSADSDSDHFVFVNDLQIRSHQKLYRHSLMKHFHRVISSGPRHRIPRTLDGKARTAVMPYSSRLVRDPDLHHIGLFVQGGEGMIPGMVNDWPSLQGEVFESSREYEQMYRRRPCRDTIMLQPLDDLSPSFPTVDISNDPGAQDLLRKHPIYADEDEVHTLPVFGDAELDTEEADEVHEHLENSHIGTSTSSRQQLLLHDNNEVIDEAIARIISGWSESKLPVLRSTARKLWIGTRDNTSARIGAVQEDYKITEARFQDHRKLLLKDKWQKPGDVHKLVELLQNTVEDSQHLKWKLSVLKSPVCPPKLPKVVNPRKARAPRPHQSSIDEDSIGESCGSADEDAADDQADEDDAAFVDRDMEIALDYEGSVRPGTKVDDDADTLLVEDALGNTDTTNTISIGVDPVDAASDFADDEYDATGTPANVERSEDSSEDEIISPSRKRHRPEGEIFSHVEISTPPPKLKPSIILRTPLRPNNFIDLTRSSDDSRSKRSPIQLADFSQSSEGQMTPTNRPKLKLNLFSKGVSPRLRLTSPKAPGGFRVPPYGERGSILVDNDSSGSSPNESSLYFPQIMKTEFSTLEHAKDRPQLLTKLIIEMPTDDRRQLNKWVSFNDWQTVRAAVSDALELIKKGVWSIFGVDRETSFATMKATIFWISWVNCDSLPSSKREAGVSPELVDAAIKGMDGEHGFSEFDSLMREVLVRYGDPPSIGGTPDNGSRPNRKLTQKAKLGNSILGTTSEEDDLSDDTSDLVPSTLTPRSTRKRSVKENMEAKENRLKHRQRVQEMEKQQTLLRKKLMEDGVSNDDPAHQAVNTIEPIVYLHSYIGRHVKPHQKSGIAFLWRELVHDDMHEGCLLAHAMGLGKTMQVISLLVTVAVALKSDDLEIRKQLPKRWKKPNFLILCPPSLIDNWSDELTLWTPDPFKDYLIALEKITNGSTTRTRLDQISRWHKNGGILIMGYELFRHYVLNKESKKNGRPLTDVQRATLKRELLDGPDIIIADEAHKLKNYKSGLFHAASQFRSRSRIALTGSPLSNHLEEYYWMINWIAPDYLGPIDEFRSKYSEPIRDGLYRDSTAYERRRGLKQLRVLNENIRPKVNRADVTAIQGDMPQKTEFVLTVSLTDVQKKAYSLFISSLKGEGDDFGQARIWTWMGLMSLICNHPYCFLEKLREDDKSAKPRKGRFDTRQTSDDESLTVSDGEIDQDLAIALPVVVAPEVIRQELVYLNEQEDLESSAMSNRTLILQHIIEHTIEARDKLLIFSQSIPTLNYLENMLKKMRYRYDRLDGSTKMSSRQESTKRFNQGLGGASVYLISTRAGGLGLNLPGANRVVIFDFNFNPQWEEQAVGRAYRLGQRKPVYVYRFKAGGTYEDILEMKTVYKQQLASRVVDKKNPARYAEKSARQYIFEPKQVEQKDLSEFRGKDKRVLDKILDLDLGCIRSITLTETFHREEFEELTAEEEQEVQALLADEIQKRGQPEKYSQYHPQRSTPIGSSLVTLLPNAISNAAGLGPSSLVPSRVVAMKGLQRSTFASADPLTSSVIPQSSASASNTNPQLMHGASSGYNPAEMTAAQDAMPGTFPTSPPDSNSLATNDNSTQSDAGSPDWISNPRQSTKVNDVTDTQPTSSLVANGVVDQGKNEVDLGVSIDVEMGGLEEIQHPHVPTTLALSDRPIIIANGLNGVGNEKEVLPANSDVTMSGIGNKAMPQLDGAADEKPTLGRANGQYHDGVDWVKRLNQGLHSPDLKLPKGYSSSWPLEAEQNQFRSGASHWVNIFRSLPTVKYLQSRYPKDRMAVLQREYVERLNILAWKKWVDQSKVSLQAAKTSFLMKLYDMEACQKLGDEDQKNEGIGEELKRAVEEAERD